MKNVLSLIFALTICVYFLELPFGWWVFLSILFAIVSIINLFSRFKYTIPYGELIAFLFFVSNVLSVIIIYLLLNRELNYIGRYYMQIPLDKYVPYGLMAVEAFLLGYTLLERPDHIWINYINNLSQQISFKTIIYIFAFSFSSIFISILHISALSFVGTVLSNLGLCACLAFYLYGKGRQSTIALYVGLGLNVIATINSGMFTGLSRFIILIGMVYTTKNSGKNSSINWVKYILIALIGTVFMAFLQNLKGDYRSEVWSEGENEKTNSAIFLTKAKENFNNIDLLNKDFYLPILFRANQGWLVSCTMEKVPIDQPFVNGETIITSFLDALLPRFLNPDKQEAGGVEKIKKFTYLRLNTGTSMGIGYLGESYVNFGVIGGVICMGLLGFIFSFLERNALLISKKYPLVLLIFPFYVTMFLESGNDFFYFFNNLIFLKSI